MVINYVITRKTRQIILFLICLFFLSACKQSDKDHVDRLNSISYSYHYRSLDSTKVYAYRALRLCDNYDEGKAEAFNNLAFVSIAKMDYPTAYKQLDSISEITDNQVELLIADIQFMRLCQRQSKNKDFYDYRERAMRRMRRINEEQGSLTKHQCMRMIYAQSEYKIVNSIYFYYVGQKAPSIKSLEDIDPAGDIERDTAQLLNYWYNIGAGGIITTGTQEQIDQSEFDYLMRCYQTSCQFNYPYWEAQSLQGLSEHFQSPQTRNQLIMNNMPAMKYVNVDNMPDSLLAGNLAQRALNLFVKYGDTYQIAGAYRTLSESYWAIKDYNSALICLQNALGKNTAINRAPDLVASIREQLCLVYSAVNQKPKSDYNRNIYLDLQEQTRQDRQLEARAGQLDRSSYQLNLMIGAVVIMIIIVFALLVLFDNMRRRSDRKYSLETFLEPLQKWKTVNKENLAKNEELYEELTEKIQVANLHVLNNKKRNVEQRAKISLVNSITPFIDRMIHEAYCLSTRQEEEERRKERYTYLAELTDKINDYNNVLTSWIQMRQGELSLHIESFALQSLFDIVLKGRMGFLLKGINLVVEPNTAFVKADKTLTLFMINTMADNARKFTPRGGTVTISATSTENYVEISVRDTGVGMGEEQLSHIFAHKIVVDDHKETVNDNSVSAVTQTSHGFGLMNCKGIIEKYCKISHIFSVCSIAAESKVGEGSRFFFRLPKGIVRLIVAIFIMMFGSNISSSAVPTKIRSSKSTVTRFATAYRMPSDLKLAAQFADSAYFSNINGTYNKTLIFADSCRSYLNKYYKRLKPQGNNLMVAISKSAELPAEIKWYHDSLSINYNIILDVRNESAIAALALHKWSVYRYNNKVYTQLFRESSADNSLTDYVRVMQKSENNKTVAVIILVILLIMIFPAYYFLYYRHRLYYSFCVDRIHAINVILMSDDEPKVKLEKIRNTWINRKMIVNTSMPLFEEAVKEIEDTLQQSILSSNAQQTNLELAEDEYHRVELENANLHISNSVLDNCLSTLKHETMYYPSRIRQLIDGTDQNLQSICELTNYYKDLYSILSAQAMRQIASVKQKCRVINLSYIESIPVVGDGDLLNYLFEILKKLSGDKKLAVDVSEKGNKYVIVNVKMPNLDLDETQCQNLFTPSTIDVQYLLCRQIVRDIGEMTNARGCGIQAICVEGKVPVIQITLAKAQVLNK
jgi:signal transduction histidine kinase